MKHGCPNPKCVLVIKLGPKIRSIVRNGSYLRKSDSHRVKRFHCRMCNAYFSKATFSDRYYQKARRVNEPLRQLLASGVSQRRAAKLLRVSRSTVARRFRFLANQAREKHAEWLKNYHQNPVSWVQFDDLETSIHTKCKPVSVALAVEPKLRKIMSFHVSQMPPKGHLTKIALKKYGPRTDKRSQGWNHLMKDLKPLVTQTVILSSDDNPHYPAHVKKHHPQATHQAFPGGRGSSTGYGELKKLKFDPLFSLNHTCAMLRANLSRLLRKTWCTSKTVAGLTDHISLYVTYHNLQLTKTFSEVCGAS